LSDLQNLIDTKIQRLHPGGVLIFLHKKVRYCAFGALEMANHVIRRSGQETPQIRSFIHYDSELQVHSSLLNVVFRD